MEQNDSTDIKYVVTTLCTGKDPHLSVDCLVFATVCHFGECAAWTQEE